MTDPLGTIEKSFQSSLKGVTDLESLSRLRVSLLGKKGSLTQAMRLIREIPATQRPQYGEKVNLLRQELEEKLFQKQAELEMAAESKSVAKETIDITLPARVRERGSLHPLTLVERKMVEIFRALGFSVEDGPEIETDYYNFGALNFPEEHPARDMQDTLFVEGGSLLRTHTSPVQIRTMEKNGPPVRFVVPGRVYRHDSDTTHSPVFHQVEGLCVGENVTFAHLKGTLEAFCQMMFGPKTQTRFRPSFFPFTEPSAEVDVMGPKGWMEILGCGMVDPAVFKAVGKAWEERGEKNPYDPEKVSGFAFGMGVERIAMSLYGIRDIRLFYDSDVRFLRQFTR